MTSACKAQDSETVPIYRDDPPARPQNFVISFYNCKLVGAFFEYVFLATF
jgi:hypothetical protein